MFSLKYEDRLVEWQEFRENLETCENPFLDCIETYNMAPSTFLNADPWDKETWPTPWELINENLYCPFCTVLGMCYSLQLTERFKGQNFEIHIGIDKQNSENLYLCVFDDMFITNNTYGKINELPQNFVPEKIYTMTEVK